MISSYLRVILLVGSIINFISVLIFVKKSSMKIEDTLFWILSAFTILLFGIFPYIPVKMAMLIKVESAVNFVYLVLIALLYVKSFFMSLHQSRCDMDFELIMARAVMPQKVFEQKSNVLLIVPAYNEEDNILQVVTEIENEGYDYIVINDGSTDNTETVLQKNNIPHITNLRNLGLSGAFRMGVRYAIYRGGYEAVCQFDGDGQHIASQIIKLRERMMRSNADVVIGSRYVGKEAASNRDGRIKRITRKYISFIIWIFTKRWIDDPTSGMRMYSKKVYPRFANDFNLAPEPDGMVFFFRSGYCVMEEPVIMRERQSGESYLNLHNAIRYMIRVTSSILIFQWRREK